MLRIAHHQILIPFLEMLANFDRTFRSRILANGNWCAFFVGPNPVISSNAMASALERCPQMAGTANSLIGSVRFAVGAIMGSLVRQ